MQKTKKKQSQKIPSKKLAELAARGASKKQAELIEIIDVRKSSPVCNYFILCSANSIPHLNAIADGIDEILLKHGIKVPLWQGKSESGWLILDLINVIIHVMGKNEREKYRLEDLWGKSGITYHV